MEPFIDALRKKSTRSYGQVIGMAEIVVEANENGDMETCDLATELRRVLGTEADTRAKVVELSVGLRDAVCVER